jgi:hypothetical protein
MPRERGDGVLSSDQKKKREFRLLDEDQNGFLDPEEIRNGFPDWTEKDVSTFFNLVDRN